MRLSTGSSLDAAECYRRHFPLHSDPVPPSWPQTGPSVPLQLISLNVVLSGLSSEADSPPGARWSKGSKMYADSGLKNEYTLTSYLKLIDSHSPDPIESTREVISSLDSIDVPPNPVVMSLALKVMSSHGLPLPELMSELRRLLVLKLSDTDPIAAYNVLLRRACEDGSCDNVLRLMEDEGVKGDVVTYSILASHYLQSGRGQAERRERAAVKVEGVIKEMEEGNVEWDVGEERGRVDGNGDREAQRWTSRVSFLRHVSFPFLFSQPLKLF